MGDENKSESLQTMVTPTDRQRIEWMAEQEERSVSDMVRILVMQSLKIWEASNAGRKRRKG